jgi:DNA-binding response OmpR family regulator
MRLLVIEDDFRLGDVLRRGLGEQGHVVDVASDGSDGEAWARDGAYEGIVLDLNLPKRDGLSVLRALRSAGISTPVLILTSRDTAEDVVDGLDAGADDYLRKPFVFSELYARLRAITRRDGRSTQEAVLSAGDIFFDLRSRRARRGDRDLNLTLRESVFLEFFLRHRGELIRREALEDAVFHRESEVVSNVIDVYVSRIRAKLVAGGEPQVLQTVRGHGFRFEAELR